MELSTKKDTAFKSEVSNDASKDSTKFFSPEAKKLLEQLVTSILSVASLDEVSIETRRPPDDTITAAIKRLSVSMTLSLNTCAPLSTLVS